MYLTHEYVLGSLKVYLNGMRLTRGIIMTTEGYWKRVGDELAVRSG
jgi:hypothetical protein